MKKQILIIAMIILTISVFAENLNENATFLKNNIPDVYNIIKTYSLKEWPANNTMALWEINQQSDSMANAIALLQNTDEYSIFYEAVKYWSQEGKEQINLQIYKDAKLFTDFYYLHVNWKMVYWQMNKEIEAKNAF